MKYRFIFYFAKKSMKYANIRTFLTILAIFMGMFSVVLLTGIAKGMNENIHKTLKTIGSDMIIVVPTTVSSNVFLTSTSAGFKALTTRFYEKDLEKIRLIPGVEMALPVVTGNVRLKYNNKEFNGNIFGVDKEAIDIIHTITVEKGRWLRGKYDVVIGGKVHEKFKENIKVGKGLIINNKTFRIVGILKPTGDALARVDNMIFIPFDTAKELLTYQYTKGEIASMLIKVAKGFDAEKVGKKIDMFLMNYKHVDKDRKGYTVITPKFISNQINNITNILNLFFLGVSGIAIIVGLVGVGNTMYMNVIDRYKEIGTLKAIGAKPKDIMKIYMIEGIILGFLGAFMGFLLALIIGLSIPFIPFDVDFPLTILAFLIIIIGSAFASFIPSKIASKIPPSIALRYE